MHRANASRFRLAALFVLAACSNTPGTNTGQGGAGAGGASGGSHPGSGGTSGPTGGTGGTSVATGGVSGTGGAAGNGGVVTGGTGGVSSGGTGAAGVGGIGAAGAGTTAASDCEFCPSGTKRCGKLCYPIDDPAFGCAAAGCSPCAPGTQALAICSAGACDVQSCRAGWADCNGGTDGCEAELASASSCGSCSVQCSGSTPFCNGGVCAASCTPPLSQCGTKCALLATSPDNCGVCGAQCSAPMHGAAVCNNGKCGVVCDPGFTLLNGACVNELTDPEACGGAFCPDSSVCVSGTCLLACPADWQACNGVCVHPADDSNHCGGCGRACGTGQSCAAGACLPLSAFDFVTTGVQTPAQIALDATDVYWADDGADTIEKISKLGTGRTTLATNQYVPIHIALDDTDVYWANTLGAAVMKVSKAGGSLPILVVNEQQVWDVKVDATSVYWSRSRVEYGATKLPTVQSMPKTGGTPFMLDGVAASESMNDPTLLISPTRLYWNINGIAWYCAEKPQGPSCQGVGAGTSMGDAAVADADGLFYFRDVGVFSLYHDTDPTPLRTFIGSDIGCYDPLVSAASDADHIYAACSNGPILRASKCGGLSSMISAGTSSKRFMAVDDQYLYWTDATGVHRRPK